MLTHFAAVLILYPRHREWIFSMSCRVCGCEHRAQDVMHEVLRYFLYPAVRNLSPLLDQTSTVFSALSQNFEHSLSIRP